MARHVDVRDRDHRNLTTAVGMKGGGGRIHAVGSVVLTRKRSKELDISELLVGRVDFAGDAGGRKDYAHARSSVACKTGQLGNREHEILLTMNPMLFSVSSGGITV